MEKCRPLQLITNGPDQQDALHQGGTSLDYAKTLKSKIDLGDFDGICWILTFQAGEILSGDYFFKK